VEPAKAEDKGDEKKKLDELLVLIEKSMTEGGV
jgi:hypothetical protein